MSSYLRDKYGNYHTEGTYLFITFFGGIVAAIVVGAIVYASSGDISAALDSTLFGFFGYYILKFLIKIIIKCNREAAAEEKDKEESTNRWNALKEYNNVLQKSLTDAGQTLTELYGDNFSLGNNAGKAVGTFVVPSGVRKIAAVGYKSIQWSAFSNDSTVIEILVNGKTVFSRKASADTFRLALYNVNDGDIVTLWVKTGDGTINGQLICYFVNC